MTGVVWLLVVVVGVLAVLVVGLLRSHAVIVRALHEAGVNLDPDGDDPHPNPRTGPPSDIDLRSVVEVASTTAPSIRTVDGVPSPADVAGTRATDIAGVTPQGATRTVAVFGRHNTLLAFLTTGCATCQEFWSAFAADVDLPANTRLVIVTKGTEQESLAEVAALAPAEVLTVMSSEAWEEYRVPVAPYFALVDGARGIVIGEGAAKSWELVQQLLGRAVADAASARAEQPVSRRRFLGGAPGSARADRVDAELRRAGIEPGDPRLHHRNIGAPDAGLPTEAAIRTDAATRTGAGTRAEIEAEQA